MEEVYAPGKWNSHLADDVAAFALAHNAADRQAPPAAGEGVPKMSYVSKTQRVLTDGPGGPALHAPIDPSEYLNHMATVACCRVSRRQASSSAG